MRYVVGDSAMKHGVPYRVITSVARTGDLLGSDAEGLLWWLGAAPDEHGYEVAGFTTDDGAIILIHAMPMRWRKR